MSLVMFLAISITGYLLIIAAYLIGSISTAIIVCKLMQLPDPRTQGSGNPGATNVLRVGGKKAAAITLFGDMLKGFVPVIVAIFIVSDPVVHGLVGIAAFLGHLYPVFFSFRGGKGVATLFGVLLGLHIWAGLCTVATWLLVAKGFKISSLSALIAAVLAPLYLFLFSQPGPVIWMVAIMSVILIWRHRSNIQRLLSGEEGRIDKR